MSSEEITRDTLGRPLVPTDERQRQVALKLAVATSSLSEPTDNYRTGQIIARAKAFERYIAGG